MEHPNNDTFCVAPWFQIRNENNMQKKVCCNIQTSTENHENKTALDFLNIDENIKLKKELHTGIKSSKCNLCWQDEKKGIKSLRQKLNGVLTGNAQSTRNTWLQSYFKQKQDFKSDHIFMADVKMGNTCNFACVMCTPDESSMIYNHWMQDPDSFFIKEKLKEDPTYLDKIKLFGYKNQAYRKYVDDVCTNHKLRYIKILGGEPLLDKYLLKKLSEIPVNQKQRITLQIVTNGSVDLVDAKNYLGNFNEIQFTISLEGVGQVQEYARHFSNWPKIEKNILNFANSYPNDLVIHHTLQTSTILGLQNLIKWLKQNNLFFSVGVCDRPKYLGFSSLPNKVRDFIKQNLNQIEKINQNSFGDLDTISFDKIIDYINDTPFDDHEYTKFIKYIQWYEKGKNTPTLRQLFPALYIDKKTY